MLRNNLTYAQASANSNRKAQEAYHAAKEAGKPLVDCQKASNEAYEAEMKWYESNHNA